MCSLFMVLCHALLFACTSLSARNAFTMIFTSSADLPETLVALVRWPWAMLVRTCALPRFDRCFENEQSFLWRHDVQCDPLNVCFVRLVQLAESDLVAELVWQKGFHSRRGQHLVLFACPLCCPHCCRDLIRPRYAHTNGGPRVCHRPSCCTFSA